MDKDTRNYLEILMSQVEALGVRVGALEDASAVAHEADRGFTVKVIHVPGEKEKA